MNLKLLRETLGPLVVALKDRGTHEMLPTMCAKLGLPLPGEGSKREKMQASFEAAEDGDLPAIAQHVLVEYPPSPRKRNEIRDLLWADSPGPEILKKHRRQIAKALEITDLYIDSTKFIDLLDSLWVLDDELDAFLLTPSTRSLRAQIERHVFRNRDDWTAEHLFDQLGAFDASNRRFVLFLEGLVSSDVQPDEASQRRVVDKINAQLALCGAELRETGEEGGYPVFAVVGRTTTPAGRPKQLIFASSIKPDLRFRDAISNDVEIVTNADKVLVYDRPIGAAGLRWGDLQSWWSDTTNIREDDEAKKTLYRRLRSSLPATSPPQLRLFETFHREFGPAIPRLPALLPEVWLHWDPKTVRERGVLALARFRMDFLMLLPNGSRIVLEVDGNHHYAQPDGQADPALYAELAAADRDLKLAGYEVFRFGAEELKSESATHLVKTFFERLFRRHTILHL
jgi:very-short-patch-repair endonuclease